MERHFPIKPGQLREMALVIFHSFSEFLFREGAAQKTAREKIKKAHCFLRLEEAKFGRNIQTELSGPPPEVIPNIPV